MSLELKWGDRCVWPETRTRVLCDTVMVQLRVHEICAGQSAGKDSAEQTQNIGLTSASHITHHNHFSFLPRLSTKVRSRKTLQWTKKFHSPKRKGKKKDLAPNLLLHSGTKLHFPFFFFSEGERESNLVWQIKAQLIFKSACSQLSHPVALSLGNIIEAHTIYTKAISFLQACQGDALGEPKIWQKEIYVQLLHIISHYDSPQSFNFKNKRPL